jgi:riboflavin synthase
MPIVVQRPRPLSMFTGIVEEMGTVVSLVERTDRTVWEEDGSSSSSSSSSTTTNSTGGTELTVRGTIVLDGAYLGCSICVSGVCLTATELDVEHGTFKVGLAPETMRKTYLGQLKVGDRVNLERASDMGGRNSGHFVQGHVDGTGEIIQQWQDRDSLFIKVRVAEGGEQDDGDHDTTTTTTSSMLKYIVPKGFIAVDGTSLTVCEVNQNEQWFTFMLVDYTQKNIIIPAKPLGSLVHLEVDVLAKYSETAVAALLPRIQALEHQVASLTQQLFQERAGQGT